MKYIKQFWNWLKSWFVKPKAQSPGVKRFEKNLEQFDELNKTLDQLEGDYKKVMSWFLGTRKITYVSVKPNQESEQVKDLVQAQSARSYIPQFSPLLFLKPLAYVLKAVGILKEPIKKQAEAEDAGVSQPKQVEKQIVAGQPNTLLTQRYKLARDAWVQAESHAACLRDDGGLVTKIIKFGLFKYASYKAHQLHKIADEAKISDPVRQEYENLHHKINRR